MTNLRCSKFKALLIDANFTSKVSDPLFLGLTSLTIQACYNCTQANTNLNPEAKSWTELSQLGLLQFKNAQQELDTIEMKNYMILFIVPVKNAQANVNIIRLIL